MCAVLLYLVVCLFVCFFLSSFLISHQHIPSIVRLSLFSPVPVTLARSGGGISRRRARRADTNILAVKFNTLTGPSHVHTGDSVVCSNPACTAVLSHLSQLKEKESTGDDSGSKVHVQGQRQFSLLSFD